MNDRYKFRAWDKEAKSFLIHNEEDKTFNLNVFNSVLKNPKYKIMQSSGLRDRNGTLIFEGDIVNFKFGNKRKNGEVTYSHTIWSVQNAQFVNREYVGGALINLYSTCEVIGNIYQNSELIMINKNG